MITLQQLQRHPHSKPAEGWYYGCLRGQEFGLAATYIRDTPDGPYRVHRWYAVVDTPGGETWESKRTTRGRALKLLNERLGLV